MKHRIFLALFLVLSMCFILMKASNSSISDQETFKTTTIDSANTNLKIDESNPVLSNQNVPSTQVSNIAKAVTIEAPVAKNPSPQNLQSSISREKVKAIFDTYLDLHAKGKSIPRGILGVATDVRYADEDAVNFIIDCLLDEKYQLVAIVSLGGLSSEKNVSTHLYRFLQNENEIIKSYAIKSLMARARPESTKHLESLLVDPSPSIVRLSVEAIGRCGGDNADEMLINFYEHGNTHDNWSFHIKNQTLIALCYSRKSTKALPLFYEELACENSTVSQTAARGIGRLGKQDAGIAGEILLEYGRVNKDPSRNYYIVDALGELEYKLAVDYISDVYQADPVKYGHVTATALAKIASPKCATTLMKIYLKTNPAQKAGCKVGEPIFPCLNGLRKISGQDFGDDRKKWSEWYANFLEENPTD